MEEFENLILNLETIGLGERGQHMMCYCIIVMVRLEFSQVRM